MPLDLSDSIGLPCIIPRLARCELNLLLPHGDGANRKTPTPEQFYVQGTHIDPSHTPITGMFVHNLPASYVDNTRPVAGRGLFQHKRDWAQARIVIGRKYARVRGTRNVSLVVSRTINSDVQKDLPTLSWV